jgi:hypothetical protein
LGFVRAAGSSPWVEGRVRVHNAPTRDERKDDWSTSNEGKLETSSAAAIARPEVRICQPRL